MPAVTEPHRDLEIVGLHRNTNGRSCSIHECCGKYVTVGSLLRLVPCVVEIDGVSEEAIKLVHVFGGSDTCHVAFIPRYFIPSIIRANRLNSFVQVVELYGDSISPHKREKSYKNGGMASCIFLEDIPPAE
jgi:hypothetical protein